MTYITHLLAAALGLVCGALLMGLATMASMDHGQFINRAEKGDRLTIIPEQLRQ